MPSTPSSPPPLTALLERHQGAPKSSQRYNLSIMSWVCQGFSSWEDKKPHLGATYEAFQTDALCTTGSFHCGGEAALMEGNGQVSWSNSHVQIHWERERETELVQCSTTRRKTGLCLLNIQFNSSSWHTRLKLWDWSKRTSCGSLVVFLVENHHNVLSVLHKCDSQNSL